MKRELRIHERFHSFQGEGINMGRSAFFIRTFGCPLHCSFCDSAGTWHPDWVPKQVDLMSVDQLASEANDSRAAIVVVTGGEPAIHDLSALTGAVHAYGIDITLETSGSFPIFGNFDCITVSPKRAKPVLRENIAKATEFKFIIETPADIPFFYAQVAVWCSDKVPIWLHPEWSKRTDSIVLGAITEAVKSNPRLRAGYQLHKLYQADSRDLRTQPLAPLGGNKLKGY